ncbi:MAG: AAA family ATPase, partial [Lachnospiraceae bacterium]|nr:AAA family ATPase [Lachnospiraceae bacterium]
MEQNMLVDIGVQSFEKLRARKSFYIDKTGFVKEWWEHGSDVTLITRPRRFGKTLNMDMLNCFFSARYAGRGDLFEGLSVWKEEKYQQLQGTYPVIFLSFASVKTGEIEEMKTIVKQGITSVYRKFTDMI